jgi:hypothetical protein
MRNSIYWVIAALLLVISNPILAMKPNYRLTAFTCSETINIADEIHKRFGNNASLAEWDTIKYNFGNDLIDFYHSIGLKDSCCALVSMHGERFYSGTTRHYYIQRCDGGLPYPGFLAHDQVSSLYIGSWYGLNMNILVIIPDDTVRFRLTPDLHFETENLPIVIKDLFGSNAFIADWNKIKAQYQNNLSAFYMAIGLKDSSCALVSVGGQEFWSGTPRHYYIQRCDAGLPYPGFLAHDQIGSLYLGSWYGLKMNVLVDPSILTAITSDQNLRPNGFYLEQNYPNPFNPSTLISFHVPHLMNVEINIYDIKGMLIRELINESKSSGSYSVEWNGKDKNNNMVSSGTYFYQLNTGEFSQTKKMILLK